MDIDGRRRDSILFPPPLIAVDEQLTYRRMLKRQAAREAEREAEYMAHIDNLFHGQEYKSVFEEYPWLAKYLPKKIAAQIKKVGHPKYDAGKES